jgi:hypothetical protein
LFWYSQEFSRLTEAMLFSKISLKIMEFWTWCFCGSEVFWGREGVCWSLSEMGYNMIMIKQWDFALQQDLFYCRSYNRISLLIHHKTVLICKSNYIQWHKQKKFGPCQVGLWTKTVYFFKALLKKNMKEFHIKFKISRAFNSNQKELWSIWIISKFKTEKKESII